MTDLEFAQVSLPSENFLQYTVVSREWNFLPESCDFEVQRRVHKLKKKTINWKIEAIRGTKKWFEDKSFSMRLPSLLKNI